MTELREKELDVLIWKLSELVAENIVNAYMVGISTGRDRAVSDTGCAANKEILRRLASFAAEDIDTYER